MSRILPLIVAAVAAAALSAQSSDSLGNASRQQAEDPRVMLEYAQFDPLVSFPSLPSGLRANAQVNLHIVQFHATPTDVDRLAVERMGGRIRGYLPHDCHIVEMSNGAMGLYQLETVRWVGAYEPAYRIEPMLLQELGKGKPLPTRRYNLVMVDKRNDKQSLANAIQAMGGEIYDRHEGGLLFTAVLNQAQLLQAARLDQVLWIDRWSDTEEDMDNARVQGGANYIETVGGYTGAGIIGHVYEGVEGTHPDFNTPIVQIGPSACGGADSHGHCTAGIVFGNGNSAPQARGMAPDAVGFFTRYVSSSNSTCATSPARNTIIGNAISTNNIMFTTASWGNARTFNYTSVSADADDIVFDHRIPWTQSQSNAGNQDSRPQAWAKNILSVGGVRHQNNSNPADDTWNNSGSTGPAQDSRSKPDLCAYYDSVWASDRTGTSGYNSSSGVAGNSTTGFGGTSAATPIVAGHNALAIQMYTDGLFQVSLPVPGGTRFENRPLAQTLKALQIACAEMYTPTPSDNRREHVGYGFPSLQNMYDRRGKITIVREDTPITQGATQTYAFTVDPGETIVKFVMSYVDPAGNPAASFDRINDLSMRVIQPDGTAYWGNNGLDGAGQTNQSASGGSADTRDTVEVVVRENPLAGVWTVEITAPTLTQDAHLATIATDATYALVVNGGTTSGGGGGPQLTTTFANNNGGAIGGAVYFALEGVAGGTGATITDLDLNCGGAGGVAGTIDVYYQSGSAFDPLGSWALVTSGSGTTAPIGSPSNFVLNTPLSIGEGCVRSIAVVANGFSHAYTTASTLPLTYANGELELTGGSASNTPFLGPVFSPRLVNTTIHYTVGGSCGSLATAVSEGAACVDLKTSFYEVMAPASMDLSGQQIRAVNSPSGYSITMSSSTIQPVGTVDPLAVPLALGDDVQVGVGTLGFTVGSNCQVSRGPGNSNQWAPTIAGMLGNPADGMYAWTDLQPNAAGSGLVTYEESGTQWMVTYDGVFLWGTTDPVTVQFRGNESNGNFVIAFGALGTTGPEDWLVGYSVGGLSDDPGPRDLSLTSLFPFSTATVDADPLSLAPVGLPVLGQPFDLTTTGIESSAVFHLGVIGLTAAGLPLSFVSPTADPQCRINAAPNVVVGPTVVFGGSGSETWQGIDLTSVGLVGFDLWFQGVTLDLSGISATTRTTNAIKATTGF